MISSSITVQATHLSKAMGGSPVLVDVDLTVSDGDRVALIGANGAGKSTLLRLLSSSTRPDTGVIHWFGRVTTELERRREIGFLSHETRLYPSLNAHENLLFAARMCAVSDARRKVRRWLESSGLWTHRYRLPAQLSRGMRQRLAIARILIHDPELILLDEPFSSLDLEGVDWLVGLFDCKNYRERAVVFVTHDPEHMDQLATRILRLQSGCLHEASFSDQDVSSVVASSPLAA